MMKHPAILLAVILMCSSCATLFNTETQKINVCTSEPSSFMINNHYPVYYTDAYGNKVEVERDRDDLVITFRDSTREKSIEVTSGNSFAYWLNLYPTPLFWTGFLFDKNNEKRFAYPKDIYVDLADTSNTYVTYYPWSRKGQFHVLMSAPHINSFNFLPENEPLRKRNTGFWGIKLGVEYYHGDREYVSLATFGVMDFFIPFPAAVDFYGEVENMYSTSVTLTNNHWFRDFSLGYGVSLNQNRWSLVYWDQWNPPPPTRPPVTRKYLTAGLVFPVKYQLGDHFYLGALYRPSFFRFTEERQFAYEHLVSFEFGWKFNSMH